MQDISSNPLIRTNSVSSTYARLDSTNTIDQNLTSLVFGAQATYYKSAAAIDVTTTSVAPDNKTGYMKMMIAPFPLLITGAWISCYYGSVTANATNYWKWSIGKTLATGTFSGELVFGTTQTSGANAWGNWTAGKPYSFNSFSYDSTYTTLAAGDILGLQLERIGAGSPDATIRGMGTFTFTWRPV